MNNSQGEQKSLEARVSKWLDTQGYPLEMEVAQAFRARNFTVSQGSYYLDPDTKEPREIDVVASHGKIVSDVSVRLTCYVQCKLARDKPWILFTSVRDVSEAALDFYSMVASPLGIMVLSSINRQKYFSPPRALAPWPRLAYGITAMREKDRAPDIPYAAVMSAAKASVARLVQLGVESDDPVGAPVVEVVLPVVLMEGALFEFFLDELGEKQLRRVNSGLLSFGNPLPGRFQATLVHVVTREGLDEFVMSLAEMLQHFYQVATENRERLMKTWERVARRTRTEPEG